MRDLKIYRCLDCGYVLEVLDFGKRQVVTKGESFAKTSVIDDAKLICCDKEMEVLVPNTTDAAVEKHLPVIEFVGDDKISVKVSSTTHPMIDAHYIEWICVVSGNKVERITLKPGQAPEAVFSIGTEKAVDVYAYCNLHGLWKTSAAK